MATTDNNCILCNICKKRINNHDKYVICTLCQQSSHIPCLPTYSDQDIEYAKCTSNNWSCPTCLGSIFPYNLIEHTPIFYETINTTIHGTYDISALQNMVFDPFSDDDDDDRGVLGDVDPDQNFLNEVRGTIIHGCNYYYGTKLHSELKDKIEEIDFSVCHLNIRSLPKNIDSFNSTLFASGMTFNILAFTETWLTPTNVEG